MSREFVELSYDWKNRRGALIVEYSGASGVATRARRRRTVN